MAKQNSLSLKNYELQVQWVCAVHVKCEPVHILIFPDKMSWGYQSEPKSCIIVHVCAKIKTVWLCLWVWIMGYQDKRSDWNKMDAAAIVWVEEYIWHTPDCSLNRCFFLNTQSKPVCSSIAGTNQEERLGQSHQWVISGLSTLVGRVWDSCVGHK